MHRPKPEHAIVASTSQQGASTWAEGTAVDVGVAVTLRGCLCVLMKRGLSEKEQQAMSTFFLVSLLSLNNTQRT